MTNSVSNPSSLYELTSASEKMESTLSGMDGPCNLSLTQLSQSSAGNSAHIMDGSYQSGMHCDQYETNSQDGSENKKQNHSEIEKRRRDKMNHYIMELSKIIPVCGGMSRKLDKLTVLRMAVQHMKTIRGNMNAFGTGGQVKPSFLSENSLHELILQVSTVVSLECRMNNRTKNRPSNNPVFDVFS